MFYEILISNLTFILRTTFIFMHYRGYISTVRWNTFEIFLPAFLKERKKKHLIIETYQPRWLSDTDFLKISAYSWRCIRPKVVWSNAFPSIRSSVKTFQTIDILVNETLNWMKSDWRKNFKIWFFIHLGYYTLSFLYMELEISWILNQ